MRARYVLGHIAVDPNRTPERRSGPFTVLFEVGGKTQHLATGTVDRLPYNESTGQSITSTTLATCIKARSDRRLEGKAGRVLVVSRGDLDPATISKIEI